MRRNEGELAAGISQLQADRPQQCLESRIVPHPAKTRFHSQERDARRALLDCGAEQFKCLVLVSKPETSYRQVVGGNESASRPVTKVFHYLQCLSASACDSQCVGERRGIHRTAAGQTGGPLELCNGFRQHALLLVGLAEDQERRAETL